MFTIDQIKEAHAKVKSGADFPAYVQDIKSMGVRTYVHHVSDGHIEYKGENNFLVSAGPKWAPMEIDLNGNAEALKHALKIHQQGQTDYMTFCRQSAEAGVNIWIVDLIKMACIYYDKAGNEMIVEAIPVP
ncbi:DUF1398 family protein [Chitinophagaceae bacterium 26-R-25]|nr:DUF1398 family protein [Chitinophagaceae bacterium 26-R-25]